LLLITVDEFLSDLSIFSFLLSTDALDTGPLSDFNFFVALLSTDLEGILSDSALLPFPDDPFPDDPLVDLLARSLLFLLSLLFDIFFFLDPPLIFFELASDGRLSDRLTGLLVGLAGPLTGLFVGSTPGRISNPTGLFVGDNVSPA
jgi:hypothetical protein